MTAEFAAQDPAYRPVDPPLPSSVAPPGSGRSAAKLIVPVLVGGALALSLGVYGRVHKPTLYAFNLPGFSGAIYVKVWLATLAVALALVQLVSALAMYGKLPGVSNAPNWVGTLHRRSGRGAFLAAVPVAVFCLYALGFEDTSPRVLVHSLLGCFFFGAFTVKMLVLSRRGMPGWALPIFGGLVFTSLVAIWLTSSLWFFTTRGVHF
jgi:Family of unknown function (DUF6529)